MTWVVTGYVVSVLFCFGLAFKDEQNFWSRLLNLLLCLIWPVVLVIALGSVTRRIIDEATE